MVEIDVKPGPAIARAPEPIVGLRMSHISKRFPGVVALNNVSFTAFTGEVHALLGENGAGKSTLMAVASGDVSSDAGSVEICGEDVGRQASAQGQQRRGLAIVHQHPAVLPDLTVAENMLLAVPASLRNSDASGSDWVREQLRQVGCTVHPHTRMEAVGVAQRQLIELAKALAIEPKILVLDEPTAALTADLVDLLFEKVRAAAARGTAIIYISHRLQEIRQIAHRVTVMRDGEVKGAGLVSDMSDEEMLRLIVGRTITRTFPQKASSIGREGNPGPGDLVVRKWVGRAFYDVNMVARSGEIVGIAGITGNGQSEFLRSLAGLVRAGGDITLGGRALRLRNPAAARHAGIAYLSSDRLNEGLFRDLSVRENAAFAALPEWSRSGIIRRRFEQKRVADKCAALAVRTPSIETKVSNLSGGNQQKVVLARALLAQTSLLLSEEPTAGVDVGARSEIYRILRQVANEGTPVVIVSSDVVELEGLCDRVIVFSRGHIVGELSGDEVTEENIGRLTITASSHRRASKAEGAAATDRWTSLTRRLGHMVSGDYAPSIVLAVLVIAIGAYVASQNIRFLSAFNLDQMLLLCAALSFIGFGQICAVFTGSIDLSVGPLAGLIVVVTSFFFADGAGVPSLILGVVLVLVVGAAVGLTNGLLVRFGNFTAVAATLGTYIIIKGISVFLRPAPAGSISTGIISFIETHVKGLPIAFAIAVVLAVGLDIALRHTRWGLSLRAVGSDERAATRIGVRTSLTLVGAFVLCSVFTAIGGLMVMAQVGIGDPNQGVEYTLSSISAVVLGGASLFGGRGSFVGVLFGAALIGEVNATTTFLGLSEAWQYWFIGVLTLGAVAIYSQARRRGRES